jgi:hypothetical protein
MTIACIKSGAKPIIARLESALDIRPADEIDPMFGLPFLVRSSLSEQTTTTPTATATNQELRDINESPISWARTPPDLDQPGLSPLTFTLD